MRQGMSQRTLAKKMKCSRTYISKIENGAVPPNLRRFYSFAEALDVSPFILIASDSELKQSYLLSDPFIAEIAQHKFTPEQMNECILFAAARKPCAVARMERL